MFTRDERRAALFLAAVAAAGALVRLARSDPAAAPGAPVVAPHLPGRSVAAQAARVRQVRRLAQPLQPGERVNLDTAGAEQIQRLPGVGPALARRVVADRQARGPFGSLAGLDRVPGVGPGRLAALEPWVEFGRTGARADGRTTVAAGPPSCPTSRISLNRATAAELDCLPGIGPALAKRIIEHRDRHGPFRQVEQLEAVAGIGPVLLRRLVPLVTAP